MMLNTNVVLVSLRLFSSSSSCGHRSSNGYIISGKDYTGSYLYFSSPFKISDELWNKISHIKHSNDWESEYKRDFTPAEHIEKYSPELTNEIVELLNSSNIYNTIFIPANLAPNKFPFVYSDYFSSKRISINSLFELPIFVSYEAIFSHKLYELILKCEECGVDYDYNWLNYIIRKGFVDIQKYISYKTIFTREKCLPIQVGPYKIDLHNIYYDYNLYPRVNDCTNNEQINILKQWVEAKNTHNYALEEFCENQNLREWIKTLFVRTY